MSASPLTGPHDPDRAVKASQAGLYREGETRAFGGGLLLTPDHVLTCAHVVNQVLGRPDFGQLRPDSPDGADALPGIRVVLPGIAAGRRLRVALAGWLPARRADGGPVGEGDVEWSGDLALLRLLDPPAPAPRPVPIGRCRPGRTAYAWFGSGAPSTIAASVVQGVTDRWIVLDSLGSAQPVVEGYSGSPLWDRGQQEVVGLVVSRSGRRAFAIPAWNVNLRFAEAGELPPPESTAGDGPASALVQQLLGPLRAVLDTAAALRDFAARLLPDLDPDTWDPDTWDPDTPPDTGMTPERLARLAERAPHGVPTLLANLVTVARTPEQREWIRSTALLAAPEQLLTATEHRELLALLAAGSTDPRLAAAEALPLGPVVRSPHWPEAVAELERYRPRHGRVPQLLRTVEFAACRTADEATARALGAWNDAVAHRLGLADALPEHRAQALESVAAEATAGPRGAPPGPVLQVRLWRATGADTFAYALQAVGSRGLPAHRSVRDRPAPRARLLAELSRVLDDLAQDTEPGAVPTVEWFVDGDELDLAVDQWIYRSDDLFPGVLGQDFLCVLRCPELRRPAFLPELRYRWQALRSGRVALLEAHDPAVQQRGAPVPVCAVVLCCPASELPRLRAIALAVGVPGVLWLRPADFAADPGRLRELLAGSAPDELPRRVYEARLGESPDGLHRSLALVWDGPEGLPDTLRLGDPRD
ncbi:trypsin-like peptidase domain-containing protein [Kitasatospora sp. NPDC057015]|uniref:VMAP-C domain-containing protein n=1 Tax=Kitasatospora sp. NPDC057015 TaxID=3346001 RepID=UPI00363C5AEC